MIEYLAIIGGLVLAKPEVIAGAVECALRVAFSLKKEALIAAAPSAKTRRRMPRRYAPRAVAQRKRRRHKPFE